MPTYGYRCESCHQEFDVWQRMADEPGAPCPKCGGKGKRQFFPAGLVFKGSGFYVTDNRGSVPSTSSSSNGSGEGGNKTEGGSKTEGGNKTSKTTKPDSGSNSGGSKTGTSSGAASGSTTE